MAAHQRSVPLRQWMEGEAKLLQVQNFLTAGGPGADVDQARRQGHGAILRKVTVAYGISEILRHLSLRRGGASGRAVVTVDNFAVWVSEQSGPSQALVNIEGVDMLSPPLSLQITEPSFLSGTSLGGIDQDQMGRYLEAEVLNELSLTSAVAPAAVQQTSDEGETLYSFGQLLYQLFSHIDTSQMEGFATANNNKNKNNNNNNNEPARKRRAGHQPGGEPSPYVPLQELIGLPSSLSLLVQNLLERQGQAEEAYDDLNTVSSDLHLLLLEPDRFLFDLVCTLDNNEKIPLQFRKEKLYGRETEVSQIQEAFCRVSSGKSEAFFIGGFSGSGKTRLVESVRMQVDLSGGYVVTRKFDAISKERNQTKPLLEVIKAFNELCILIKDKNSPRGLEATAANLLEAFGADVSILARLLPNLSLLLPRLKKSAPYCFGDADQMNLQSVGFVLRRFMRVVSSRANPLMLFFDDLQWCDPTVLTVIEGILADGEGGPCLFFVGSYRSNEVRYDHPIFRFMENLDRGGVVSTKLNLFGINYNDLNIMVSDATGLFPRLCSNLSDIIFQKTKGNPFFVLEFLRLLVDGNLLQYSVRKRRWVWDEEAIMSMEITNNVLSLLCNKMSQLSEKKVRHLKVVSCFGFGIHESVVDLLSATAQYSDIKEGLNELVVESFMTLESPSKGKKWNFVHDKVREAAYSLISDKDKDKYHEDLGQVLHSIAKGKQLGEAIFPIVDQINRSEKSWASQTPASRIDIAQMNLDAGIKCCEQSDFSTAMQYLNTALSLLPKNHWVIQYDLSLQLHFLSAKSAYSCGNGEKACEAVQAILNEGRCIDDKVDAYFLLVHIYHAREEVENAYLTCLEVLAELGEKDFLNDKLNAYCEGKDLASMVAKITKNLERKTEEDMMAIKGDSAVQVSSIMKFYNFIIVIAFLAKPEVILPICCRMVELTLAHGVSKYSVIGILQYSAALCQRSNCKTQIAAHVQGPCNIAKLAISLLNRIEASDIIPRAYLTYYGVIAHYTDPVQSCDKWLKKGFEAGMSNGDTFSAFFSANHRIRLSLISGGKLPTLLRLSEYYLSVVGKHDNIVAKKFFLMYQQTIRVLIDKGASNQNGDGMDELSQSESVCIRRMSETMNFQKALQSFWLGYAERCHHYVLKLLQLSVLGRHHRLIMAFYHGISSFTMLKRQRTSKLRQIPKDAIEDLKVAAKDSKWNYGNKVHLLDAELSSYEGRNEDANSLYAAAILSARASRFIHEQGLACELAGFHYKKIGDLQRAFGFFNQAKMCYAEWGSEMKVNFINRQLAVLGSGRR